MHSFRSLFLLLLAPSALALPQDPSKAEVLISKEGGFSAYLILDNGGKGIWCTKSFQLFPEYGTPEVVGLDDAGKCQVMISYSGKWTPRLAVHDGKWLGAMTQAEIDPTVTGEELYVAGERGSIYQVVPHRGGLFSTRLVAELPGREVHTMVGGELDPAAKGNELLVFTRPGGLFRLRAQGPGQAFHVQKIQELDGRVRDALVLPGIGAKRIATVSRAGRLALLTMTKAGAKWQTVYEQAMGMGRLALGKTSDLVLYSTHDDGRILRHAEHGDSWQTETIFVGPQGPRGLAVGRFSPDPEVETVAIFGYSGKVQLLSRRADGPWQERTIFTDRDKGHWLQSAELDGRNHTDELIGSGYGGRIFMLVLQDPEPSEAVDTRTTETDTKKREAGQASQQRSSAAGASRNRRD